MRVIPALAALALAISDNWRSYAGVSPRGRGRRGRGRPGRPSRGMLLAIQHAVMRDVAVSRDILARQRWRNERKRARRAAR